MALRKTTKSQETTSNPSSLDFYEGEYVIFHPSRGTSRRGRIEFDFDHRENFCLVKLQGDPYSVYIATNQLEKETTNMPATKKTRTPKANETAEEQVEPAAEKPTRTRKATAAKRPARKAPAAKKEATVRNKPGPKVMDRPADNPFRPGSNSHHYTEALKKGGKRSTLVHSLLKKIEVHPWQEGETYDDPFTEVDKRLTMVAKQLEQRFGFVVERRGRGSEGFVKATPPSEAPRKASATKKRASAA